MQLSHHCDDLLENHELRKFDRHSRVDAHRVTPSFAVNDLVVIRDVHRPPGLEGKLRRPYLGPWVITAVTPAKSLRLADLEGRALQRAVPIDQVRLWHTPAAQPGSTLLGGEDVAQQ
jgi:hypothetical protein